MLSEEIALAVDEANNATLVTHTFTRFDVYNNRSVYISGDHEPSMKDELTFYRTFPKPNGSFLGTRKTAFKFSKETPVLNKEGEVILSPFIFEVSCSIPLGVDVATQILMRQRAIALLDRDILMNALNDKQNI